MSKNVIKKVKVALTISRPSTHDGRRVIALKLGDKLSGITFVDVEFPMADFMEAICGLSHVEGAGEVRGLENVGKIKEVEQTHFLVPTAVWSSVMKGPYETRTERGTAYLRGQFARDGWHIATRLGSQNAEITVGANVKILGSYYRYVNEDTA